MDEVIWGSSLRCTWILEFETLLIGDLGPDILKNQKVFHCILSKTLVRLLAKPV